MRIPYGGIERCLVRRARHRPGIVFAHEILHAVAVHDDVVDEADALTHGDKVEIVGEKVEVDVRLDCVIRRAEADFPTR